MARQVIDPISDRLNIIGDAIVDAAFIVHTKLGPGLLEGVYEICMMIELEKRGFKVRRQVPVALDFALPLSKDSQDDTQWFSFSLGIVP